jgi:hypothetical protein
MTIFLVDFFYYLKIITFWVKCIRLTCGKKEPEQYIVFFIFKKKKKKA